MGWLWEACSQQRELVGILWREPRFRTPLLSLWVSDAGSSLHSPVVTYFFLRLGATPMEIGILSFGMRSSTMLLAPVYGRLVDKHGIAGPLLCCVLCCGFGCLLRASASAVWQLFAAQVLMGMGGGSQWSMVKGYIAPELDDTQRALLVVGLKVQMTVLSLGRLFFPVLDTALRVLLGMEETLLRYRGEIGTCAAFCWAGILILACGRGGAGHSQATGAQFRPAAAAAAAAAAGAAKDLAKAKAGTLEGPGPGRCSAGFLAMASVLAIANFGQAVCGTLWPIYIAHHFGWEARAYAYLSFMQVLLMTGGLALYPRAVQGRSDHQGPLQVLAVVALLTLLGFFAGPDKHAGARAASLHVALSVPCLVAVGTLAAGAEAAASLHVPAAQQGWAMGFLNAAAACGALVGSLLGPALWTWSLRLPQGAGLLQGGRLPFLAVAGLLLASLPFLRSGAAAARAPDLSGATVLGAPPPEAKAEEEGNELLGQDGPAGAAVGVLVGEGRGPGSMAGG